MGRLVSEIWKTRDLPSAVLLGALLLAAGWVLALPVSGRVQESYLRRFHLQSRTFGGWAAQQLTPAMYNLENTYWFSPQPLTGDQRQAVARRHAARTPGPRNPLSQAGSNVELGGVAVDMINHFPTRTMTFVQSRAYLSQQRSGTFYFQSRYRDRVLESAVEIVPLDEHRSCVLRREARLD